MKLIYFVGFLLTFVFVFALQEELYADEVTDDLLEHVIRQKRSVEEENRYEDDLDDDEEEIVGLAYGDETEEKLEREKRSADPGRRRSTRLRSSTRYRRITPKERSTVRRLRNSTRYRRITPKERSTFRRLSSSTRYRRSRYVPRIYPSRKSSFETITLPISETTIPPKSETITPRGSETITPLKSETTTPRGSQTTTPPKSETITPRGSETTTPPKSETTTPRGSETITPHRSIDPVTSSFETKAPPKSQTPMYGTCPGCIPLEEEKSNGKRGDHEKRSNSCNYYGRHVKQFLFAVIAFSVTVVYYVH